MSSVGSSIDIEFKEEVAQDAASVLADKEEELSSYDIEQLEDVLEKIAEEKKIRLDQSELDALKEDVDEYKEVKYFALSYRHKIFSTVLHMDQEHQEIVSNLKNNANFSQSVILVVKCSFFFGNSFVEVH